MLSDTCHFIDEKKENLFLRKLTFVVFIVDISVMHLAEIQMVRHRIWIMDGILNIKCSVINSVSISLLLCLVPTQKRKGKKTV